MTGNTGILFDDIKVQQAILHDHDDNEAQGKHIHAHVLHRHIFKYPVFRFKILIDLILCNIESHCVK
jgi:hypothetical protein